MTFTRRAHGIGVAIALLAPVGLQSGSRDDGHHVESARYVSLTPCRLLDTRTDNGIQRIDESTVRVEIVGRCGVDPGAEAAALTLTVTGASQAGFAAVNPSGEALTETSNVNFEQGETIANSVIARLGNGAVDIHHSSDTDLVLDVVGQFRPAATSKAGRFIAIAPSRVLDTRADGSRSSGDVDVDLAEVVPDDAMAVVATVTIIDTGGPGHYTVYRSGEPMPLASFANSDRAGQTRSVSVIAPLASSGFVIHRSTDADLAVDIAGYFTGSSAAEAAEGLFVPIRAQRALDTRSHGQPVEASGEVGVPPVDAGAVVTNVTTVGAQSPGYVTLYPQHTRRPEVSIVNTPGSAAISNLAITATSTSGLAAYASTGTHVIVDVLGHFVGTPVPTTLTPPSTGGSAGSQQPDRFSSGQTWGPRDPWLRPFDANSIWNTPIGSNAKFVESGYPVYHQGGPDPAHLVRATASDPVVDVHKPYEWKNRCNTAAPKTGTMRLPHHFHIPDAQLQPNGSWKTPNDNGVVLDPDGRTLRSIAMACRDQLGGPLHAWTVHTTDIYGDGIKGGHGATQISAYGGAIRNGELTGDAPIAHALDLIMYAEKAYMQGKDTSTCYRWPASRCDSYAGRDGDHRYSGTNPEFRIGALLAIPKSTSCDSLGLESAEGAKLCWTMQHYGGYWTDDSAWNANYIKVEAHTPDFYAFQNDKVRRDMGKVIAAARIVANNAPDNIGGGGTPLAPRHVNEWATGKWGTE